MPPPSSYIDIPSLPFSRVVTQAEFNVANEIWFRRIAPTPEVFGVQTNSGGTFTPRTLFYDNAGDPLNYANNDISGYYVGFYTADTYYIKVINTVAALPTDFDFTFTADIKPLESVLPEAGDILINDDLAAALTAIVVPDTGVIRGYLDRIPGGEIGAILPSGVTIWHDRFEKYSAVSKIAIFDADLNYVLSVACGVIGTAFPVFGIDIDNDQFYVVNSSGGLWRVSSAGVATDTEFFFSVDPWAIAISPDGTKLYWGERDADGIIHVLDIATLTPLSDLYTIPSWDVGNDRFANTFNGHPGDMFCLPNGDIVTWWYDNSLTKWYILHLSSAGALLHQHEIPGTLQIDHLAYITDSNTHIYLWVFTNDFASYATIGKLELATGTITEDFTNPVYSAGDTLDDTVTEKFGFSNSCTFVIITEEVVEPPETDRSGIYFINTTRNPITGLGDLKHDRYYLPPSGELIKKIPNPTIKTALLGE